MIWSVRMKLRAGTLLLFIRAPPMPPIRIPMQITYTLFGSRGIGPVRSMPTRKNKVPAATIFGKFFLGSGIKLRTVDVSVYVMVSIEKITPMIQVVISSSFNLSWRRGSLKVRHISEVDMHRAVAAIF